MGDGTASKGPSGPRPADLVHMLGQFRRGSAADAPLGFFAALGELIRTPGGAPDSRLNARDTDRSELYRDLATPNISTGEPAPDFALAKLDLADGRETPTGQMVRLSAFRQVSPVALIFGSYT